MAAALPIAADMTRLPPTYPVELVQTRRLSQGTEIILRPIHPGDDAIETAFIRGLSRDAGYKRLLSPRRLTAEEIRRLTRIDYVNEMAYVAVVGYGAQTRMLGVARYARDTAGMDAEFALVVADAWQQKGIGTMLLDTLAQHARAAGIVRLHGITLATNQAVQNLTRRLGFVHKLDPQDATVRLVEKTLQVKMAAVDESRDAPRKRETWRRRNRHGNGGRPEQTLGRRAHCRRALLALRTSGRRRTDRCANTQSRVGTS
jgi:GNAT superfamily N-acetyltransferase